MGVENKRRLPTIDSRCVRQPSLYLCLFGGYFGRQRYLAASGNGTPAITVDK